MGNTFLNIPVPAANGSGAAVDVSTIGFTKTISVAGPFIASVNIEISNEAVATKWAPLATFDNPDGEVIQVACKWMRATVRGYVSGTPQCDVGGPTDAAQLASLPVSAGNGSGAAVDTSTLGLLKTVTVGGPFKGTTQIEISEDGNTKWSQVGFSFDNPGQMSELASAKWMRVTRYNVPQVDPGTPIVNVAALDVGGGGGGGGGGNAQRFVYTATGAEGASFDIPLPAARLNTNYVAQVTGGGMAFQLTFDTPVSGYTVNQIHVNASAALTAGDKLVVTAADLT